MAATVAPVAGARSVGTVVKLKGAYGFIGRAGRAENVFFPFSNLVDPSR